MSTIDEENLKLAVLLRAARNILGLSLKDVGEQLGVTSAGAGKWESGVSPIKASVFNQLEKFYRYHGIEMEINGQGEPVVKLNPAGLKLLRENPKKPTITDLSTIYFDERTQAATRDMLGVATKRYELKRLREKYPDLSEEELESALNAVLDLKDEQWERLIPHINDWMQKGSPDKGK